MINQQHPTAPHTIASPHVWPTPGPGDYDPERYKQAAELAATQQPDIDPSLYDPHWFREQDHTLADHLLRWLRADTRRRLSWPITVPQRDRDLTSHLDHTLPHPLGTDLGALLIRAVSAQVMHHHIKTSRAHGQGRR